MILGYLICEAPTAESLPARRGLGGARLRAVVVDGLAAVYSHHRSVRASPEAILTHQKVIEAVMTKGTVLPLRFGTRLANEQALIAAVSAQRDDLIAAMQRVRGQVEMGLRVIPRSLPGDQRVPRGQLTAEPARERAAKRLERKSGREYLLARVGEHRLAEQAKREIHVPLSALANAHVLASRIAPPAILAASYLVGADDAPEFRLRAIELAAGVDGVDSFLTGPWPPYSFVDLRPRSFDSLLRVGS